MSCDQFQSLITGYLDGELSDEQRTALEVHIADCQGCQRELAEERELKAGLDGVAFREPGDDELERFWQNVYNRTERGLGWILFTVGAIALLSFGTIMLITELFADSEVSWIVKIGVVAVISGLVLLFVSILRERLTVRKTDKYSKEVMR
jgi:hypothetical protein